MNNRRNTLRSKRNDDYVRYKKFLPLGGLLFLAIAVGILLWPKRETQSAKYEVVSPTKPTEPKKATIYLDNSASMEGYAHGGEYIDALADLMSIYPGTKARFTNDTMVVSSANELTNLLTRNQIHYKGQSLLNKDLKSIVNQLTDSNEIAFFVTDGILSGSDADIKAAKALGHNYNIDHKQDLMNNISKVFKDKKKGVALFRMLSKFHGEYYCYDNSHKNISTLRSYYIIALGEPSVLSDFKHKLSERQQQSIFKLRPVNEIDFIEPNALKNCNLFITAGEVNRGAVTLPIQGGTVSVDVQKISKSVHKKSPVYNFMIGDSVFSNYSLPMKDLANNLVVSIDGTKQKVKASVDSTRNSIVFHLYTDCLSLPSKIRIYIPYLTPAWIDRPEVSNEDDSFMINGISDTSTFLFSYLINGIKNNGVLPNDFINIYDTTVTFKHK